MPAPSAKLGGGVGSVGDGVRGVEFAEVVRGVGVGGRRERLPANPANQMRDGDGEWNLKSNRRCGRGKGGGGSPHPAQTTTATIVATTGRSNLLFEKVLSILLPFFFPYPRINSNMPIWERRRGKKRRRKNEKEKKEKERKEMKNHEERKMKKIERKKERKKERNRKKGKMMIIILVTIIFIIVALD